MSESPSKRRVNHHKKKWAQGDWGYQSGWGYSYGGKGRKGGKGNSSPSHGAVLTQEQAQKSAEDILALVGADASRASAGRFAFQSIGVEEGLMSAPLITEEQVEPGQQAMANYGGTGVKMTSQGTILDNEEQGGLKVLSNLERVQLRGDLTSKRIDVCDQSGVVLFDATTESTLCGGFNADLSIQGIGPWLRIEAEGSCMCFSSPTLSIQDLKAGKSLGSVQTGSSGSILDSRGKSVAKTSGGGNCCSSDVSIALQDFRGGALGDITGSSGEAMWLTFGRIKNSTTKALFLGYAVHAAAVAGIGGRPPSSKKK